MDNARYHYSNLTKDYLIENDIAVIFNSPYRPDLNGIERFWAEAKRKYKKVLTEHQVHDTPFETHELVAQVLDSIDHEKAMDCANYGWRDLKAAQLKPVNYEDIDFEVEFVEVQ